MENRKEAVCYVVFYQDEKRKGKKLKIDDAVFTANLSCKEGDKKLLKAVRKWAPYLAIRLIDEGMRNVSLGEVGYKEEGNTLFFVRKVLPEEAELSEQEAREVYAVYQVKAVEKPQEKEKYETLIESFFLTRSPFKIEESLKELKKEYEVTNYALLGVIAGVGVLLIAGGLYAYTVLTAPPPPPPAPPPPPPPQISVPERPAVLTLETGELLKRISQITAKYNPLLSRIDSLSVKPFASSNQAGYEITVNGLYLYPVKESTLRECADVNLPCWRKTDKERVKLSAIKWKTKKSKTLSALKKEDFDFCVSAFESWDFLPQKVDSKRVVLKKDGDAESLMIPLYLNYSECPFSVDKLTINGKKGEVVIEIRSWK